MTDRPRVVQVCADYLPEKGGIPAVVSLFQDVFQGGVVSFAPQSAASRTAVGLHHVPVAPGVRGRAYGWSAAVGSAREALQGAELLAIHGLFRFHAQWAWAEARKRGIPHWVVPHGALDPWVFTYRAQRKKAWMSLVGRRIIETASAVIYATEREREKAGAFVDTANGVVIPWPVNQPQSAPAQVREEVRRRLGVPDGGRLLLSLGRLHPMKRIPEIIGAVGRCSRSDLHLVVVGPGSAELTEEACRTLARNTAGERIHVVGPAFGADKEGYFAAADGFINLSHRENFGVAVAEALSHGLPVILSPGNDLAPALSHVGCGWLTASQEPGEEQRAVEAFACAAHDELREMADRGRRWTAEHLGHDRFSARLLDLARLHTSSAPAAGAP